MPQHTIGRLLAATNWLRKTMSVPPGFGTSNGIRSGRSFNVRWPNMNAMERS